MKKGIKRSSKKWFIGVDLHTTQFTVCFLDKAKNQVEDVFDLNSFGFDSFIAMLNKNCYVLLESTSNAFAFEQIIKKYVKEVKIGNTYKMKLISITNKKTDKVDAHKLATYLKMQILGNDEMFPSVYVPSIKIQNLRSLMSTYLFLNKEITQTKNKIHGLLKQHLYQFRKSSLNSFIGRDRILSAVKDNLHVYFQTKVLLELLYAIEDSKKKIEQEAMRLGANYMKEIDILTSIKGVSIVIALAIIADIETVKRFPNAKHFTSYLRTTPTVSSSNNKTHIGRTNKAARKLTMSLLMQPVIHFKKNNPNFDHFYKEKDNANKGKRKIQMAICRKTLTHIYHMLTKEEYHYYRDPKNHEKKMKDYQNFLKRQNLAKIIA